MKKTILIGMNNKFSANANKWLFSLTGLLFLGNGALSIYSNIFEPIGLVIGIFTLFGGLFYSFYGLFGFSENSKFASRVSVDNSTIEIKNSIWKPSFKLNWSDLSSIEFQSYQVTFNSNGAINSFSYRSNADVSKTIKQTIREFAERKNIAVTGG
jgi:hypothetical protein